VQVERSPMPNTVPIPIPQMRTAARCLRRPIEATQQHRPELGQHAEKFCQTNNHAKSMALFGVM